MMSSIHTPPAMLPPMVDTHCHLDDKQFQNDLDDVITRSRAANITRWVLIAYDPDRWDSATTLARSIEGMSYAVGVHPSCAQVWSDDVAIRLEQLAKDGAVAIGEAGLDFYRDNAAPEIQEAAFREQMRIATRLNLPLIIHMRAAEDEMLRILRSESELPTLVFHSFDGSDALVDYILASNSYVGVGGLATRQGSTELRERLQRVPLDRVLLETDSPYLVPARQKDRRNQPANVPIIAEMMAPHFHTSAQNLAEQTTRNAERVLGLSNGER